MSQIVDQEHLITEMFIQSQRLLQCLCDAQSRGIILNSSEIDSITEDIESMQDYIDLMSGEGRM